MPTILNIETSTDICSVCIASGLEVLAIRETPRSYSHSESIAVFIDECLKELDMKAADLDAVRVGETDLIIPMIDARRSEVYRAIYNSKGDELQPVEPIILDETTYTEYETADQVHFCGDGTPKSKEILSISNAIFHDIECSAIHMVPLSLEKYNKSNFEDIAYYEPLYYKGANITVQKKNILR